MEEHNCCSGRGCGDCSYCCGDCEICCNLPPKNHEDNKVIISIWKYFDAPEKYQDLAEDPGSGDNDWIALVPDYFTYTPDFLGCEHFSSKILQTYYIEDEHVTIYIASHF